MNTMSIIESTVVSITERPGVQEYSGTSEKPDDNKESKKYTNTQTGQVSQTY